MGQIRHAELSEKGLSNGLGRGVAEDVEAQVGLAAKAHIGAISRLLEPALHTVLVRPGRGSRWPPRPRAFGDKASLLLRQRRRAKRHNSLCTLAAW